MESDEYWEMLFADWNEMCLNYPNKKTIFSDYFHLAALKSLEYICIYLLVVTNRWKIYRSANFIGKLAFKMYSLIRQGVKFWQMTAILSSYL